MIVVAVGDEESEELNISIEGVKSCLEQHNFKGELSAQQQNFCLCEELRWFPLCIQQYTDLSMDVKQLL